MSVSTYAFPINSTVVKRCAPLSAGLLASVPGDLGYSLLPQRFSPMLRGDSNMYVAKFATVPVFH